MAVNEIEVLKALNDLLSPVDDPEALGRILAWIDGKFRRKAAPIIPNEKEIPGIALLEQNGTITFTIRDIKAKSANDAAVRLALVAAYTHEKLTGNEVLPRKTVLVPLLRDWRIDNGNSRTAIGKHRGIIPVGTYQLKLDSHAKEEAERIISEILDPSIEGPWKPRRFKVKAKAHSQK